MNRLILGTLLMLALPAGPALATTPQELAPDPELRFSGGSSEAVADSPWWTRMGDAALAAVVEDALHGNLDLERLRALERQSEAAALQSFSPLAPTVTGNAQAQLAPRDSLGFGFIPPGASGADPNAPKTYTNGQATLDARWGLDVFGRNAATWRAAQRDITASRSQLDDLSQGTAGMVANAYLDVVTARRRVEILQAQIQTNQELLEVLQLRYERGDASSLDVLQQRQSLSTVQAQLPSARLLAETASQRLAVLLGRPPMNPPQVAGGLPELDDVPTVGTPADLVNNRPDLRAEAARLKASRDRRWSAYMALAPSFSVTGKVGWQFIDLDEFNDQTYWNAGASVSVPIFGGGANLGRIRQARAALDAQAATFRGQVLAAMQEVEQALAQERLQREAVQAQTVQLQAARDAAQTARSQYLQGLAPFLNVQSAITREQQAELSLLQARRDLLTVRINLYTALGGPWTRDIGTTTAGPPSSEAR